MSYLLMEILLYLLIAGVIGFVVGWFVRGKSNTETTVVVQDIKSQESTEKVVKEKEEDARLAKEESEKVSRAKQDEEEKVAKVSKEKEEAEDLVKEEVKKVAITKKLEKTKVTKKAKVVKEKEKIISNNTDSLESNVDLASKILLPEARAEGKDKLTLLRGRGPVLEERLNKLGVFHLDQIASWNAEEQEWIGKEILLVNRVEKEEWVKQAKEILEKK